MREMKLEKRLYTESEIRTSIVKAVQELHDSLEIARKNGEIDESTVVDQWSSELLPSVEQAIAEEVVRRHVMGVTFSVWSGPPASGKGTNIQSLDILGKAYAEVTSQGFEARLPLHLHEKLLSFSVSQASVSTGTGGIFNNPKGEYRDLFALLDNVTAESVARGEVPDGNIASPLIEFMILLRLVQGAHRVQIDLWPRKLDQFEHYLSLAKSIREAGGKIIEEFVTFRLLDHADLAKVQENPAQFANTSIEIGSKLDDILATDKYKNAQKKAKEIVDAKARFEYEDGELRKLLNAVGKEIGSREADILIKELVLITDRMAFRFSKELEKGGEIRPDAYPLTVLRRLKVYLTETSLVFLKAPEYGMNIAFVSVFYSPSQVIKDICTQLIGVDEDKRWERLLDLVGTVAEDIVQKKDLIITAIEEAVWGIIKTE